jgi:hypothetical protein
MAVEPSPDAGFSDREVRLIFERAGKLDGASDHGERRMSLAEIQDIGAQAGLDPRDVATAAASIRAPSIDERISGAPARFRIGTRIDERLGEDGVSALVHAARDATGYHGSVNYSGAAGAEWRARSALGAIIVSAHVESRGTRIDVVVSREDARVLATIASGVTGLALGGWVASFAAHSFGASIGTSLVTGAATAVVSGWGIARATWRPISQRWAERTRDLLAAVTRAVETKR